MLLAKKQCVKLIYVKTMEVAHVSEEFIGARRIMSLYRPCMWLFGYSKQVNS